MDFVKKHSLGLNVTVDSTQAQSIFQPAVLFAVRVCSTIDETEADLPFLTRVKVVYKLVAELKSYMTNADLTIKGAPAFTPFTTTTLEQYAKVKEDRRFREIGDRHHRRIVEVIDYTITVVIRATAKLSIS